MRMMRPQELEPMRREIDDQHLAAGLQRPSRLRQHPSGIVEIVQHLVNHDQIGPACTAIEVRNVSQVFKTATHDVVALSDVSLEIKPGRFIVLVGPSGCGKSTLLMMMAGLQQPGAGTIRINGTPIDKPDPNRVAWCSRKRACFPG